MYTTTLKVLELVALLCVLLSLSFVLANRSYASTDLSEDDKAKIIKFVLRRELAKMKLSDTETHLLVIEEPIRAELLSDITKGFTLIEQAEVSDTLTTSKSISYYSVRGFWMEGRKVTVLFSYSSGDSKNNSGSVSGYKFRKVSGRWKGKFTGRSLYCGASLSDR